MQSPQSPYSQPPIPSPDGNLPPVAPVVSNGDWQSAPPIVRGWAYPLTWLAIVVFPILILVSLMGGDKDLSSPGERIILAAIYALFFGGAIWLNRALKKGAPAAWIVQIIFSALGLLGFPLGTIIHGYILSQWFKPETKAWFGQS